MKTFRPTAVTVLGMPALVASAKPADSGSG
jgi:hypothetical protein